MSTLCTPQQAFHDRLADLGLSPADFAAKMLAQNNCCKLCSAKFSLRRPPQMDHNRYFGDYMEDVPMRFKRAARRDLLCPTCYRLVDRLEQNRDDWLRRARKYFDVWDDAQKREVDTFAGQVSRAEAESLLARLTAVGDLGEDAGFMSDAVRDDYEVAMTAVLQNGGALEHVSDRLRSDREIVDAAVRENRLAARFASELVESMDALELDDSLAAFEPRDD